MVKIVSVGLVGDYIHGADGINYQDLRRDEELRLSQYQEVKPPTVDSVDVEPVSGLGKPISLNAFRLPIPVKMPKPLKRLYKRRSKR